MKMLGIVGAALSLASAVAVPVYARPRSDFPHRACLGGRVFKTEVDDILYCQTTDGLYGKYRDYYFHSYKYGFQKVWVYCGMTTKTWGYKESGDYGDSFAKEFAQEVCREIGNGKWMSNSTQIRYPDTGRQIPYQPNK